MSRAVRALAVLAALVVAWVGNPVPAQASAAGDYANQAFRVTNDKRENHGLRRLQRSDCLQTYARRQAVWMANHETMRHQDLGRVLDACNLSRVGENVAYGYPSGRAVVGAWMRSPGHRANILSTNYRRMGLAARKGDNGRWYVAQVFGRGR
jgi:uncharacterized protein YkwD